MKEARHIVLTRQTFAKLSAIGWSRMWIVTSLSQLAFCAQPALPQVIDPPRLVKPVIRRGPGPSLERVTFTSGGRYIVAVSRTGWVSLFDAASGAELWRFSRDRHLRDQTPATSAHVVEANPLLVALGLRDAAELWNTATRERLFTVSLGPGDTRVELSDTGHRLTGWTTHAIGVWNTNSEPIVVLTYPDGDVQNGGVSPDESTLIIARRNCIEAYSLRDRRISWSESCDHGFLLGFENDDLVLLTATDPATNRPRAYLLDVKSGRRVFEDSVDCLRGVTWAPQGRFYACYEPKGLSDRVTDTLGGFAPTYRDEFTIRAVLPGGPAIPVRRIVNPEEKYLVDPFTNEDMRLALSQSGSRVALSERNHLRIWNTDTGTRLLDLRDRVAQPVALDMTPGSTVLAVRTAGGQIISFGLKTSTVLRLANPAVESGTTAIVARANVLLRLGSDLVRTDITTGREERCESPMPKASAWRLFVQPALAFDSFSRLSHFLAADDLSRAVVVNQPEGLFLHVLDPHHCGYLKRIRTKSLWSEKRISGVELSPDGRYCAIRLTTDDFVIVSTVGGVVSGKLRLRDVAAFTFSRDSRSLILATGKGEILTADAATGRITPSFQSHAVGVSSMRFTTDGAVLMVGTSKGEVHLLDRTSGSESRFAAHTDAITALAANGDGLLATAGSDGTVALWSGVPQALLARIIVFDDGGWAVIDPEGRFDTNDFEALEDVIQWRVTSSPLFEVPAQAFLPDFYYPQLLSRLVLRQPLPRATVPLEARDLSQPLVEITKVTPEADTGRVKVTVAVTTGQRIHTLSGNTRDGKTLVRDLRLFRDGEIVGFEADPATRGRTSGSDRAEVEFTSIQIPTIREKHGPIEFAAYAFNGDHVKSATAHRPYSPAKDLAARGRHAYLLSFAVGQAQDPSWGLWFSVSDALRVERILTERLSGTFDVREYLLLSRSEGDGQPTATERPATKTDLRATLAALTRGGDLASLGEPSDSGRTTPATPDDIVVLFISAHGYVSPDGTFYLIPSDTGSRGLSTAFLDLCAGVDSRCSVEGKREAKEFLSRAISASELAQWLRPIDAGRIVMILDSCHSAAAAGLAYKPGPLGDPTLGQLYYDKRMLALAASEEQSPALGTFQLGRSLLAQALLTAAERPDDQDLSVWLAEAARMLPDLYHRHFRDAPFPPQVPRLYDFTGKGTGALLKRAGTKMKHGG